MEHLRPEPDSDYLEFIAQWQTGRGVYLWDSLRERLLTL